MKIALVVNPFSGGKRTGKRLSMVKRALEGKGIESDIFISRFKGHLAEIARNLDPGAYGAVAAMGGDGTSFHMINGLLSAHRPDQLPPLALLPSGSGNSFARDLELLTLEQGIQAIVRNRPRPVDLLRFSRGKDCFYFINLMGLGFVTDVAVTAERFKVFHDLSYLIGVIHRTASLSSFHMELKVDGKPFSGPGCFVEICNSRYTGGSMLMAPGAEIDDGLMDIVIAGPLTRRKLLGSLPRIYSGTHIRMKEVSCIQGKKLEIKTFPSKALLPDGEIMGVTPGTVEVLPQHLRVLS
ncbi:diacylglycerol/lipid kinase family protein [Desulfospira joergensenii]|uniref:diacylglycerol/lipid kinase family protein n=1 Tax=Desulfospira joergensenii TaxID=53329 RepID=UPI0003B2F023|nr:diacylglycerol kinase family protein [Desulfospira joergensenii]